MSANRTPESSTEARHWSAIVLAVMCRPWLWLTASRQVLRIARRRWWRRRPFLPVPDPAYLEFRIETAYGHDGQPAPREVVAYLEWCRQRHRESARPAR